MKNIQVIDGAENCVYDIFAATDEEFTLVFPKGTDITFIDEVYAGGNRKRLDAVFNKIWQRRVKTSEVQQGIHGTIFYEPEEKKLHYPSRRDEKSVNPDGSNLR